MTTGNAPSPISSNAGFLALFLLYSLLSTVISFLLFVNSDVGMAIIFYMPPFYCFILMILVVLSFFRKFVFHGSDWLSLIAIQSLHLAFLSIPKDIHVLPNPEIILPILTLSLFMLYIVFLSRLVQRSVETKNEHVRP